MSSVSALNSLLSSSSSSNTSGIDLSALLEAATGASSEGIDVNAAVNAAITAAEAPEQAWQSQQTDLQNQGTALSALQTDATNLDLSLIHIYELRLRIELAAVVLIFLQYFGDRPQRAS